TDLIALVCCFFFSYAAPPAIYTLSLHDALPICAEAPRGDRRRCHRARDGQRLEAPRVRRDDPRSAARVPRRRRRVDREGSLEDRSEEHTSELQSPYDIVCRLLLEKKNNYRRQVH